MQREFPNLGINHDDVWWQQDVAPSETNNVTINYLLGHFSGKPISKRGDFAWPEDLQTLRNLIFFPRNRKLSNLNQLRAKVVRGCGLLQRALIISTFDAIKDRCQRCINVNGQHFG